MTDKITPIQQVRDALEQAEISLDTMQQELDNNLGISPRINAAAMACESALLTLQGKLIVDEMRLREYITTAEMTLKREGYDRMTVDEWMGYLTKE